MATIEVGAWIHDKESLEVFLKKNTTATPQTSKEIAQTWSDAAKAKAFFSARVTSTDVLEEMRKAITWVVEGRATEGQAKAWIRDFFDTKGESALREMGYLPSNDTKKEGGNKITQLASATRIALIVDQNVRMSTAAKQWHDFQRNAWYEYVMYHTKEDGRVRNSHAMLDRKIWRKNDPAVKKVWPPQDFRCRCWMEPMWEEDVPEGSKITDGLPDGWQPADSGYTFDPEEWPFNLPPLKPSTPPDTAVEIKKEVEKAIIDKVLPPTIKPPVLPPIVDVTKPINAPPKPTMVVNSMQGLEKAVPTPNIIKMEQKEQSDFAVHNNIAERADYTGIDPEIAKDMNQAILPYVQKHPWIRPHLQFVGSTQKMHETYYNEDFYQSLLDKGYDGKEAKRLVGSVIEAKNKTIKDDELGFAHTHDLLRGITINDKLGKSKPELLDALANSISVGFHPPGYETVKGFVDHEMAHIMDHALNLSDNGAIKGLWDTLGEKLRKIGLSEYSNKDIGEFIAEAWTEYSNSLNPRPIAKALGGIIASEVAKWTRQTGL